jgi:hypothetical protein
MPTDQQKKATAIPKWLLYGLIAKGIIVVVITIAVMWVAGVFG